MPPSEPGKCYQKCLSPAEIIWTQNEFAIFTGNDDSNIYLKDTTFIIPPSKKWVKKKSDTPCHSPNPEDCLVWCLEQVPQRQVQHTIMIDSTQTDDFIMKRLELGKREMQQTEWQEVVCAKDVSPKLITQICSKLQMEGYSRVDCSSAKLDSSLKNAINAYQKDNQLPIGGLNMETMYRLGISSF
jgi:hypothetical protein